jgi:transposase InsO family protein
MRYLFIASHQRIYPVTLLCEVLEVSRSGFYDWQDRTPSPRSCRQADLTAQVHVAFAASRHTYGSPRITHELADRGMKVCRNTVARIMRQEQLAARPRRRFVPKTTDSSHDQPVAPNHLDRRFEAGRSTLRAWVGDITYIPTQEGWLYLAAIMDLKTRRIVGWATADHLRAELALDALHMALANSQHLPLGLIHHSDRGIQYACRQYREVLESRGIVCSMSRTGNCYDNAVMESFWATLKTEEVYRTPYATRAQARQRLFDYIEVFYNRQRRHSALGYLSPEAFEARMN